MSRSCKPPPPPPQTRVVTEPVSSGQGQPGLYNELHRVTLTTVSNCKQAGGSKSVLHRGTITWKPVTEKSCEIGLRTTLNAVLISSQSLLHLTRPTASLASTTGARLTSANSPHNKLSLTLVPSAKQLKVKIPARRHAHCLTFPSASGASLIYVWT